VACNPLQAASNVRDSLGSGANVRLCVCARVCVGMCAFRACFLTLLCEFSGLPDFASFSIMCEFYLTFLVCAGFLSPLRKM